MADLLKMHVTPALRDCSMVLAFDGWNDAGGAASSALSFISDAIQSVPLAEIDPEEFYDFTVNRPEVSNQAPPSIMKWCLLPPGSNVPRIPSVVVRQ